MRLLFILFIFYKMSKVHCKWTWPEKFTDLNQRQANVEENLSAMSTPAHTVCRCQKTKEGKDGADKGFRPRWYCNDLHFVTELTKVFVAMLESWKTGRGLALELTLLAKICMCLCERRRTCMHMSKADFGRAFLFYFYYFIIISFIILFIEGYEIRSEKLSTQKGP